MHRIAFLIFIFFHPCYAEYKYSLSICAIFQDEAPYLKEWIEFHRLVGVEHFYLYNHRSTDHYNEILQPYIQLGIVELTDIQKITPQVKDFTRLQSECYTNCTNLMRGKSRWLAFLDIDEFLYCVKGENLQNILKDYEKFGGVGVNWRIFGTSHIWKIPPNQLLIENLTLCTPKNSLLNRDVKCIVKPERVSHFENHHFPIFHNSFFAVNTDKLPLEGMYSTYIQTNKLRINHYWTRDGCYFYQKKIPRQQKWGGRPLPSDIIPKVNAEKDEVILQFVPALKSALGFS